LEKDEDLQKGENPGRHSRVTAIHVLAPCRAKGPLSPLALGEAGTDCLTTHLTALLATWRGRVIYTVTVTRDLLIHFTLSDSRKEESRTDQQHPTK
jgi:hypothetical protein